MLGARGGTEDMGVWYGLLWGLWFGGGREGGELVEVVILIYP